MIFKLFVILLLLGVVASLFSGLFFMFRDRPAERGAVADPGRKRRAVRALTVRISLSLLLFAVLILGYHWGWYTPGMR